MIDLSHAQALVAARLPLDVPPFGLRARPECLALDEDALVFHGALRAPLYRADDDAPIPPWEDVVVRLGSARDALTTERAEALIAAWLAMVDEVMRSLVLVPNPLRPAIAAHTIGGSAGRPPLARVAPEEFARVLRGPTSLGGLLRLDPERARPIVRGVARTLAEILPVEAGIWRFARAKAPVCSTPLGIQATFALTHLGSRATRTSDVLVLPAWALADVERALIAIRAQAIALADLLEDATDPGDEAFALFRLQTLFA